MSDLSTEIKISANADGVETGVARAKRSLADLGAAATAARRAPKAWAAWALAVKMPHAR